jgi:hypothetical protein
MFIKITLIWLSLCGIYCESNDNTLKTQISKFPPVVEYIVQRIQGYYSVHVHPDESLLINKPTTESSNDFESNEIKASTENSINRINRTDDVNKLEEFVLQYPTLTDKNNSTLEVVIPIKYDPPNATVTSTPIAMETSNQNNTSEIQIMVSIENANNTIDQVDRHDLDGLEEFVLQYPIKEKNATGYEVVIPVHLKDGLKNKTIN